MITDASAKPPEATERYNLGYEQRVLGCMLTSPAGLVAVRGTGLEAGEFYKPAHETLYAALCAAADAGNPTDMVAMAGQLLDTGELNRVGGATYLHDLVQAAPPAAEGAWFADKIRELAHRRGVLTAVARVGQAVESGADAEQLMAIAETVVHAATSHTLGVGMVSLGEFAAIGTADIEMRRNRTPGLPTGLHDLDDLFGGGMRAGQMVVFAGRPGTGKSTVALDIARRTSVRDKLVTAYFTMEMSTQEMFDRCLSAEASIPYEKIHKGELGELDWDKAVRALDPMSEAPLYFDDRPGQTLAHIANQCTRLQARVGLDLIVIDYLQLIKTTGRSENRQQEVAANARGVKQLGVKFRVPVVALVQLNRDPEKRADKAPQASDIRDSGEIEQAADIIVMIHREDMYEPESPRAGEADFYVRKNRTGRQDVVTVAAQLHMCRFQSIALEDK